MAVEVTGGPEIPFHPGREVSDNIRVSISHLNGFHMNRVIVYSNYMVLKIWMLQHVGQA